MFSGASKRGGKGSSALIEVLQALIIAYTDYRSKVDGK